jgi:hypothetical protein
MSAALRRLRDQIWKHKLLAFDISCVVKASIDDMATLGDSTSKRLAAVVKQISNSPAVPAGIAGAKYHGDAPGGRISAWGRAPTGRSGSMLPVQPLSDLHKNMLHGSLVRRREKVRPNSEGTKCLWDTLPSKTLPKAPAKGGRPSSPPRRRPQSSHAVHTTSRCAISCRRQSILAIVRDTFAGSLLFWR